jgi:hypothetical protein
MIVATSPAVLTVVYDLRAPDAWSEACRHGRIWGRLYTEIHTLDAAHIALVFRPAPNVSWRAWQAERLRWIRAELEDLA